MPLSPLELVHSPSEVIQQLLINLGFGVAVDLNLDVQKDWTIYEDKEPSSPDKCITCYDTSPKTSGRSNPDGEQMTHFGIQIRVRGTSKQNTRQKAELIRVTLNQAVTNVIVIIGTNSYLVPAICNTNMMRLGQQQPMTKRFLYTINGTTAIRRIT